MNADGATFAICPWCREPYEVRTGGKPQRYCSPRCRSGFHTAARIWAEREIEAGRVAMAQVKEALRRNVHVAPCRQAGAISPSPVPDSGPEDLRAGGWPAGLLSDLA